MADIRRTRAPRNRRPALPVLKALAALLVVAWLAAACGSSGEDIDTGGGDETDADDGSATVTGEWTIREITSDGETIEPPEGATVTLDLDGRRMSGRAACNSYEGQYRVEAGRLVVSDLFWTEMGCEPPLMELEQLVLGVLADSPLVDSVGTDLVLIANTTTLVFGPTPEVEPAPLIDTEWVLSGFIDGEAASTRPDVERVHLLFARDGSLGGNAGCNSLRSAYTSDGNDLSIGEIAITRMSCGDKVDELEQSVLGILGEVDRYDIDGTRLLLWAGDQALDLVARPSEGG